MGLSPSFVNLLYLLVVYCGGGVCLDCDLVCLLIELKLMCRLHCDLSYDLYFHIYIDLSVGILVIYKFQLYIQTKHCFNFIYKLCSYSVKNQWWEPWIGGFGGDVDGPRGHGFDSHGLQQIFSRPYNNLPIGMPHGSS